MGNITNEERRQRAAELSVATVKAQLDKEPRVKIVIDETADESASKNVFVGVNGVGYWMQRGKEISVPQSVVNVLNEQRKTVYRKRKDEMGREELYPVQVPPYPFHIVP